MTDRKCRICFAKMNKISLESDDESGVHIHSVCNVIPQHDYFCETNKCWVG